MWPSTQIFIIMSAQKSTPVLVGNILPTSHAHLSCGSMGLPITASLILAGMTVAGAAVIQAGTSQVFCRAVRRAPVTMVPSCLAATQVKGETRDRSESRQSSGFRCSRPNSEVFYVPIMGSRESTWSPFYIDWPDRILVT